MAVTVALFAAGVCLGVAGAFVWAWGVRSGQFRDLEKTKDQLFWPDVAGPAGTAAGKPPARQFDGRTTR